MRNAVLKSISHSVMHLIIFRLSKNNENMRNASEK